MTSPPALAARRSLANKVPEVTVYFWVIKVLCTTIGETAADFLNTSLGFGLVGTSVVTGVVLAVVLVFQFRAPSYVPGLYWSSVALVSVFGTLVTDNLTDNAGVPLQVSAPIFGVVLAGVFLVWYRSERTLSIHSIITRRRESFYWLAVFFTFALGTATGDLMAEALSLGYLVALLVVAAVIAALAVAWRLGLHPVLAFWIIYVLTRPLGASLGDLLSQAPDQGGLGLGTTVTSVLFLVAILGVVVYLTLARPDVIPTEHEPATDPIHAQGATGGAGLWQTVIVVGLLLVGAGTGYVLRTQALDESGAADPAAVGAPGSPGPAGPHAAGSAGAGPNARLGDLSNFRTITSDTLRLLNTGDQAGATNRVTDLETAWDQGQGRLKARDNAAWTRLDGKIDTVLTELRSSSPDLNAEKAALNDLLAALN